MTFINRFIHARYSLSLIVTYVQIEMHIAISFIDLCSGTYRGGTWPFRDTLEA